MKSQSRRAFALLGTILLTSAFVSCSARPGDAPTVEEPAAQDDSQHTTGTNSAAEKTAQQKAEEEASRVIRVGVDSFTGNLNPHLQGNLDPVISAIADLTLPSVYEMGEDGESLNHNLMKSVEPNDPDHPTKVTFEVNSAAQWSDGTPITVSDFQYLASTVAAEPNAAEMALYQRIKNINASVSATKFTVEFDQPFSSWKRLFRHLLPSHIYRGENRPFARMMQESSAASGGAYTLKTIDAGRGTAELQRNDRYWGENPAMTDRIFFTAVPDVNTGAQMLRTKQINMLMQPSESTTQLTLDQLSDVEHRTVVRPAQLNLVLGTQRPGLTDERVRTAILNTIDASTVGKISAEDLDAEAPQWSAGMRHSSGDKQSNVQRVSQYFDEENPLVIAAPIEDSRAVVAARTVADQLSQAGISARAIPMDPAELFAGDDPKEAPDATIMWQYSPEEISEYVSQFQCHSADVSGLGSASKSSSSEKKDSDAEQVGNNVSGLCDSDIDKLLDQLERGEATMDSSKATLDEAISQRSVVLPLLGSRYSLARADELVGPSEDFDQWPTTRSGGLFASAPRWTIHKKSDSTSDKITETATAITETSEPEKEKR